MSPQQLLKIVKKLDTKSNVTNKFITELAAIGMWDYEKEAKKTYGGTDQKLHWTGWLAEYDGPGFYNRKNWEGITAKKIYNRINCPPMLIWLAESSGVSKSTINKAVENALSVKKTFPSQCSAIRQIISWEVIEKTLKG